MKCTQWLWIAGLLIPLGGCADSSGSSADPFADATVVEVSPSADDSGVAITQDSAADGLAEVTSDTAVTDSGSVEPDPTDTVLADSGAPDVPAPQDTSDPGGLPEGLTGQAPPSAESLPSLAGVVDTTGAPAVEDQLKNHWSVLWFYPLASTSG
jgi:hypothetical protein